VPVNVGVLSLVADPLEGLEITGADGVVVVVLIVIVTLDEDGEVFPALSVAFALRVCEALVMAVVGVADQEPVLDAVAVAIAVVLVPS
jgi:hypothetical protein